MFILQFKIFKAVYMALLHNWSENRKKERNITLDLQ